eukprot:15465478-Alexandrium_andersonii.AAC.1
MLARKERGVCEGDFPWSAGSACIACVCIARACCAVFQDRRLSVVRGHRGPACSLRYASVSRAKQQLMSWCVFVMPSQRHAFCSSEARVV